MDSSLQAWNEELSRRLTAAAEALASVTAIASSFPCPDDTKGLIDFRRELGLPGAADTAAQAQAVGRLRDRLRHLCFATIGDAASSAAGDFQRTADSIARFLARAENQLSEAAATGDPLLVSVRTLEQIAPGIVFQTMEGRRLIALDRLPTGHRLLELLPRRECFQHKVSDCLVLPVGSWTTCAQVIDATQAARAEQAKAAEDAKLAAEMAEARKPPAAPQHQPTGNAELDQLYKRVAQLERCIASRS